VKQFGVTWPVGYGAPARVIHAFRAIRWAEVLDRELGPGYGPIPTLFVIGPDGIVRWNDHGGRYRHRDPRLLMQDLEREIDLALVGTRPSAG
jgi:hypothetical protein